MRIDIHHHYFPDAASKEKLNSKIGWQTPPVCLPWSPEVSLNFMNECAIDTAILSLPATPEGNRHLARQRNQELADICKTHPTRFGFFAMLPTLDDIDGL